LAAGKPAAGQHAHSSSLLFCRTQQLHGAYCLAAGLPAVGLRPWASCRCAPPTVAGKSGSGSARCGGDRHMLAGVRLPLSRASPRTTLRGVEAASNLPSSGVITCRRAPPTVAGESENASAWCGGGRQAPTTSSVQVWMFAGACLPLSRASPGTAPRCVAAAGERPTLFGPGVDEFVGVPPSVPCGSTRALAKRSGRKPSSDPSRQMTSLLLEGVIKNMLPLSPSLICSTPRYKDRAKALPSPCRVSSLGLADDDYAAASFTSLEASLKSSVP